MTGRVPIRRRRLFIRRLFAPLFASARRGVVPLVATRIAGCLLRLRRDAGRLAHRARRLGARVDVRARRAAPRRGIHRGRRGGGRRGGEAHRHSFSREVLASSATRDAAFSVPKGEGLAGCRRGRREPRTPRARSTHTSRRAPPILRSLRSRTRASFEPVVSRAVVRCLSRTRVVEKISLERFRARLLIREMLESWNGSAPAVCCR